MGSMTSWPRPKRRWRRRRPIVLDGFRLRSDAKIVRWPDRYMDGRGRSWGRVMELIGERREEGGGLPTGQVTAGANLGRAS